MYSAQKYTKINNVDMKGETHGLCKYIKGVTIPEMKQRNRFRKVILGKGPLVLNPKWAK